MVKKRHLLLEKLKSFFFCFGFVFNFFCSKTTSLLEKGKINLELGDYMRARGYFEAEVNKNPSSAEARLWLGKALMQQFAAQPEDSSLLINCITQLEASRTIEPGNEVEKILSIAWFKRAKYLVNRKDTISAIRAISRSISLDPKATGPLNLAGTLYFYRCETSKALNLFKLVIKTDTNSVSGYFNTGMVYWADSNYSEAYSHWCKAAILSPEDREILVWAARARERISRKDR